MILYYFLNMHPHTILPYRWNWYYREILILKEHELLYKTLHRRFWPQGWLRDYIEICKSIKVVSPHGSYIESLCSKGVYKAMQWFHVIAYIIIITLYLHYITLSVLLFMWLLLCIQICLIYSCVLFLYIYIPEELLGDVIWDTVWNFFLFRWKNADSIL